MLGRRKKKKFLFKFILFCGSHDLTKSQTYFPPYFSFLVFVTVLSIKKISTWSLISTKNKK